MHGNYSLRTWMVLSLGLSAACGQLLSALQNQKNAQQPCTYTTSVSVILRSHDYLRSTFNLPSISFLICKSQMFMIESLQCNKIRSLDLILSSPCLNQLHIKALKNVINLIHTSNFHVHTVSGMCSVLTHGLPPRNKMWHRDREAEITVIIPHCFDQRCRLHICEEKALPSQIMSAGEQRTWGKSHIPLQ